MPRMATAAALPAAVLVTGCGAHSTAGSAKAVTKTLHNAMTAELTLFTDDQQFTTDLSTLENVEPNIKWGQGLTPPSHPGAVNVAVSTDRQVACLTTVSSSGRVYVLAGVELKAHAAGRPLSACTLAVVLSLTPAN